MTTSPLQPEDQAVGAFCTSMHFKTAGAMGSYELIAAEASEGVAAREAMVEVG